MKRIWKEYFSFSKKERIAVIILLLLITGFLAAPYFYPVKKEPPIMNQALVDFIANAHAVSGDSSAEKETVPMHYAEKNGITRQTLFPFDPNTVTEEGWSRLGVGARTVHTILNYRNKGGRFRLPEDIRKIWGLKKEDADKLIPFIQINGIAGGYGRVKNHEPRSITPNQTSPAAILSFDINMATAETWKKLPGIGEVLANRIVKFRDKIGGFLSIEQVKKTYGISDTVFGMVRQYLKMDPANLPKLNLNTATAYDLRYRMHISYDIAKAIINRRQQYGPYQSVADLKKINGIPDTLWQKLLLSVKIE